MGMPLPTTSSAAVALCALIIPFVIGPSADAVSATGAFVPPPTKTSTKQTCAGGVRAGARHATSRCRRSIHVCSMSQDGNDGIDCSENSPTNERSSRQRYTQKRASPQAPRGGRGDGKDDDGPRRRRRGRPRQNRQNNFGGARADGRTSRRKRGNASPWPRYKSEIDAALEIAGADADVFEASIDSFLEGEYSQPFAEEAPAPHPGLTPRETLDCALRSLRRMDEPYESHGAAVFMRFCVPLTNSERWGLSSDLDPWKTILRGALSPSMLARQLRASSSFASLLDWKRLDVSDGFAIPSDRLELGVGTTLAFVNAAVYFQEGVEPAIIQFTLRKIGGAWMIDDAVVSKRDWFVSPEDDKDSDEDGINRNDSGIGGGKGMP